MKEFSVCYDRFCQGNYTLVCDVSDTVQATADLGAFEMYVLGMWNDGLVVTMRIVVKISLSCLYRTAASS